MPGRRSRKRASRAAPRCTSGWSRLPAVSTVRIASPREPVRARAAAVAERGRRVRDRPERLVNVLQECKKAVEVSIPIVDGRRRRARLHRLPRHAQRRARPVEGRHPLPPRRHPRRGQGARDVDDVEVRADGPPVRRREGRRRLRSEGDVARRARADDAPLHVARSSTRSARRRTSPRPTSAPTAA